MSRFCNIFKRSKKPSDNAAATQQQARSTKAEHVTDVATVQVAGMQRTKQNSYIASYTSTYPRSKSTGESLSTTWTCDSSQTAVDQNFVSTNGASHWKGVPNGRAYDNREELTEEDEDMWAKMAM